MLYHQAAIKFEQNGDMAGHCDSLLRSAYVCLSLGHTDKAAANLQIAEQLASTMADQARLGRVYALQGNLDHSNGNVEGAQANLQKAVSLAEKNGLPSVLIAVHNDLGNLFGSTQRYTEALAEYRTSALLAEQNGQPLRKTIALTNGARVCIADADQYLKYKNRSHSIQKVGTYLSDSDLETDSHQPAKTKRVSRSRGITTVFDSRTGIDTSIAGEKTVTAMFTDARAMLKEADASLADLQNSQDKILNQINLGLAFMDLGERYPKTASTNFSAANRLFLQAAKSARNFQDARLLSYAIGNLGRLCHQEGQLEQASELTNEAIYWADQASAPESRYRWEWERARILTDQNHIQEALAAYQDAILTLASIRDELSNCYGMYTGDLRKAANELYLMYVDVLLRDVDDLTVSEQTERLKMAREVVEKRKVSELRDYFKDDCLGQAAIETKAVDELLDKAVVIYPILLSDRLEIIAAFPNAANHDDVPGMPTAKIRHYKTVIDSQIVMRTVDKFRQSLEIKATDYCLIQAKNLYDWIIRPMAADLRQSQAETLVFVPDGALRSIPMGALYDGSTYLIQSYGIAITPGLTLTDPTPMNPEKIRVLAAGIQSAHQGFQALPGVGEELQAISSLHRSKLLIDDQFSLENFEEALQKDQYNIVHIASHGTFSDTVAESFILTADERLTFNDLSELVGLYRFREKPLELLTLSACETAMGNDQAALGLAGIAIKIGARSALATLWAVDDQAAAKLITEFYQQICHPKVSRSEALRQAKLKMLDDPLRSHPGYWAPFILINNWL
ncbi:tetratricopeptide repeat domain protein [Desulfosarcina variabilis str. Montpellier]